MVKLLQMLQGNAEYFGLLLIKSSDPYGHKRIIFASVYKEMPNFLCTKTGFIALKLVANIF